MTLWSQHRYYVIVIVLEAQHIVAHLRCTKNLILIPCASLMKMNAFVPFLIWGFQRRHTKLINWQPRHCVGSQSPGWVLQCQGVEKNSISPAVKISRMGKPWAVHFTLCVPIIWKYSHRQAMAMFKNAASINAMPTDFAVGNKLRCCWCYLQFWCRCAALFPFNLRHFLWTLLLGRRMNGPGGSKCWYLFQSTCLQTRQYA